MKSVIYFNGTSVTDRLLWEMPDAFLVNEAYPDIDILSIAEDDLPRESSDGETLIHGLYSLLGKRIPPDFEVERAQNTEWDAQRKFIIDGLETADEILMELQDMSGGVSVIGVIIQNFFDDDFENRTKSLFRMLRHVTHDMDKRIYAAMNYVEAAVVNINKLTQ